MNSDTIDIENELRDLQPARLSDSQLGRFSAAMDAAASDADSSRAKIVESPLGSELSSLERTLGNLVPHGMPENMISRLDEAMARWHEKVPLEEKVVALPSLNSSKQDSSRGGWRMVAAVAISGVAAAFLTSGPSGGEKLAVEKIPVRQEGSSAEVVFKPASGDVRQAVVEANDYGVFWTRDGMPYRFFEVESQAEVHFQNDKGEKLIIARPKKEISVTPVKFD